VTDETGIYRELISEPTEHFIQEYLTGETGKNTGVITSASFL
jgi:hypothetical protein